MTNTAPSQNSSNPMLAAQDAECAGADHARTTPSADRGRPFPAPVIGISTPRSLGYGTTIIRALRSFGFVVPVCRDAVVIETFEEGRGR